MPRWKRNIASFEILAKSQKDPVRIPSSVIEPTVPIKPSRVLYIGMGLIFSFGLGLGLVFLLEHVDHSVKVPEHVTQGLTLPLLGVVPRIRRTALTHRGGHLWTPGTPDSIEADAFRNIRASLLGVADRRGPIITLLVTSPKAGDGKSTAALNVAATCARAGERTLLLDVDLRRPSLGDVFPAEPEKEGTRYGLVDVLQGTLPWQKTLRHTELRNLDFIPTGDPRDIPVEILGTLELRQLLTALIKPLRPGDPGWTGRPRDGRLPDAGTDGRRLVAGGPCRCPSAHDAAACQGYARAVTCPHCRCDRQQSERGRAELVELWLRRGISWVLRKEYTRRPGRWRGGRKPSGGHGSGRIGRYLRTFLT